MLNSSIGFLNTTKEELNEILKITEDVLSLAERGSKRNTSNATRRSLAAEFQKLGDAYRRIVGDANVGDYDVLSEEDIAGALELVGLDKETSDSIAAIFKKFKLSEDDDSLASDYMLAPRPVHIPASAYLQQVIVPGTAGNGDGTFNASFTYEALAGTPGPSYAVLSGDFNNDGTDDLFYHTNLAAGGTAEILLAQGDGTYVSNGTYDARMGYRAAVGDVNGDSRLDVVGFANTDCHVLLGNGDGTFLASSTAVYAFGGWRGTLVDMDQDGDLDVVSQHGTVFVSLNNGDGTFAQAISYQDAPYTDIYDGIISADVNNDSHSDIVLTTQDAGGNSLRVLLGNADGSLSAPLSFASSVSGSLTRVGTLDSGYFNDDGRIDLVLEDGTGSIYVYSGNGDGSFASAVSFATGLADSSEVKARDVNGDSKTDFVVSDNIGHVSVLAGNGNATFHAGVTFDAYVDSTGYGLAVVDSRGNGIPDIVTTGHGMAVAPYSNTVSVLLGNGNASVADSTTTMFVPRRAPSYSTIFDEERPLKNQIDWLYLLADAKELKTQVEKNLKAIDYGLDVIGKNIDFVRGAGFAFLDVSNQLKGTEEAEAVVQMLQQQIRQNAPAALAQAENLNPIVVATLTVISDGLSYKKE